MEAQSTKRPDCSLITLLGSVARSALQGRKELRELNSLRQMTQFKNSLGVRWWIRHPALSHLHESEIKREVCGCRKPWVAHKGIERQSKQ